MNKQVTEIESVMDSIIALIPAYCPDEKLEKIVSQLYIKGFDIVIVDDGSGQKYKSYFKLVSNMATVLSYPGNQGKGYALKKGMQYIDRKYKGKYVVVTLDSDGQHAVEDAYEVCIKATRNRDCLVLGSRKFTGTVPFKSRWGNAITRCVFKWITGLTIFDTQTGLRAFSSDLIRYMSQIDGERYEYEMNVLMHCSEDSIPIIEKKIETIYLNDNKGSHFNPVKDTFKIYRVILGNRHGKKTKNIRTPLNNQEQGSF